ncbi:MAG: hypothetical protein KDC48_19655 [Planctomycetes bacterium]|nr:hypothetical protein [Planctomycetota bacterium]
MTPAERQSTEAEALARYIREALADDDTPVPPAVAVSVPVEPVTDAADDTSTRWTPPGGVLLLGCAGVAVAVPVDDVAGVQRFTGPAPACIEHEGREVAVVPPHRLFGLEPRESRGGVLVVARNAAVALPCEQWQGRRELQAGDVRTRRADAERRWLGGLLRDEPRCVLHLAALIALVDGTEPA